MNLSGRTSLLLFSSVWFLPPSPALAQEVDNRPIFYVMLKSLEEHFQTYNEELEADLAERLAALRDRFEERKRELATEAAALEEESEERQSAFNRRRDELNARIRKINERIALRHGEASEQRRFEERYATARSDNPRVAALESEIAEELAEIEKTRRRYMELTNAVSRAREELKSRIEENIAAGHPLAQEIRTLNEDLERYADEQRSRLKAKADAYATDYAEFDAWLDRERDALAEQRRELEHAAKTDQQRRALHERRRERLASIIEEYNTLVEIHQQDAEGDAEARRRRAAKLRTLEARIEEEESALERAREAVIETTQKLERLGRRFEARYEAFLEEKRAREKELQRAKAELDAARVAAETRIDQRRRQVETQVKALEEEIGVELQSARRTLEALNGELVAEFGRDHAGLGNAIARVVEEHDSDLLYEPNGSPRFDLSAPRTSALYTSVERIAALRGKVHAAVTQLDPSTTASPDETTREQESESLLEQELAEVAAERQTLVEEHAAYARELRRRASELERRTRAVDSVHAEKRRALGEVYAARASLTRNEFANVQAALIARVQRLETVPRLPENHEALEEALREKADRAELAPDDPLRAPNALYRRIAVELAGTTASDQSRAWTRYVDGRVVSSRELRGADKRKVIASWYRRLRAQGGFAELEEDLARSDAVNDVHAYVNALFSTGLAQYAVITEQRLAGGDIGIQVTILEHPYQLNPRGSLEVVPPG